MEITQEQLDNLKDLAQKATPGPWEYEDDNENIKVADGRRLGCVEPIIGEYIAAASPYVVLALIAENERLEKEADWLAKTLNFRCHGLIGCNRCSEDVRTQCRKNNIPEVDYWRLAAHKAVEEQCQSQ